jgi:hypothetical protein
VAQGQGVFKLATASRLPDLVPHCRTH